MVVHADGKMDRCFDVPADALVQLLQRYGGYWVAWSRAGATKRCLLLHALSHAGVSSPLQLPWLQAHLSLFATWHAMSAAVCQSCARWDAARRWGRSCSPGLKATRACLSAALCLTTPFPIYVQAILQQYKDAKEQGWLRSWRAATSDGLTDNFKKVWCGMGPVLPRPFYSAPLIANWNSLLIGDPHCSCATSACASCLLATGDGGRVCPGGRLRSGRRVL